MTETKSCWYCAEDIRVDAIKCKHCGEWLNKPVPKKTRGISNFVIIAAVILLVAIMFYVGYTSTTSANRSPNAETNISPTPMPSHNPTPIITAIPSQTPKPTPNSIPVEDLLDLSKDDISDDAKVGGVPYPQRYYDLQRYIQNTDYLDEYQNQLELDKLERKIEQQKQEYERDRYWDEWDDYWKESMNTYPFGNNY